MAPVLWPALLACTALTSAPPPRARARTPYTAALIVPTGIGASIGGYAGDALPVARALASVVDVLVTHPNVMNGAMLYWPPENALYVEGYALDEFARGDLGLLPVGHHRIGLVLDAAIEPELRLRHLQAADAARATLGLDVGAWALTDEPLGVGLEMLPSGGSWGTLGAPDSLVRAARRLVDEAGCTALALVARFPDDEDEGMLEAYRQGDGVDAVGGVEALISHLVTRELRVPCAHAPALAPLDADESVSERACAEELGYTFLPCVLANLHRAPALVPRAGAGGGGGRAETVWAEDVDAVVVPASACGGSAVLSLAARGDVLIVAVEENGTVMRATPDALELERRGAARGGADVALVRVGSYAEAIGVIAAHRAGVDARALTSAGVGRIQQL